MTLLTAVALLQYGYPGWHRSVLFGLPVGLSIFVVLFGLFGLLRRPSPKLLLVIGPLLVVGLCTGLGPMASTAYCQREEADIWDELTAAMESDPQFFSDRWTVEYEATVAPQFHQPTWRAQWMLARAREQVALADAAQLRTIRQEIAESDDPSLYADATQVTSQAFAGYYQTATHELYAPVEGDREFPVDDELRAAFVQLLEDLTHAPTAQIHVVFAHSVDLTPPPNNTELLASYRAAPKAIARFPDGAPLIEPKESLSAAFIERRRQTFMTALSESFGQAFEASLLELVPLGEGDDREGKIILEVHSHVVRLPLYFYYNKGTGVGTEEELAGLLFGIGVDWELSLFDRGGRPLYRQPTVRSEPAGSVGVAIDLNDPDWGMYSVLMDSAYYNYSRQVTGLFGLVPPPHKTQFAYQGLATSSQ